MMIKLKKAVCILLLTAAYPAYAELSFNPWTHPNTKEDIDAVYQQRNKKNNLDQQEMFHKPSYIAIPINSSAKKITNTNIGLSNNTSQNNQVTPPKRTSSPTNSLRKRLSRNTEETDSVNDFIPQNIHLPKVNTRGLIQKFERASGINFKSIVKKINGK